jgi:hypothetical protein
MQKLRARGMAQVVKHLPRPYIQTPVLQKENNCKSNHDVWDCLTISTTIQYGLM